MPKWKKGDIVTKDGWTVQVLGGPTRYGGYRDFYYTVRLLDALDGSTSDLSRGLYTQGDTFLSMLSGVVPGSAQIPIATCPNCEIDEMILYAEDYICAWCRERLEENILT